MARTAVDTVSDEGGAAWLVRETGLPRAVREDLARHGGLVLLATDLSDASAGEDAHAIDLAARTGARVVILGVPTRDESATAAFARRLRQRVRGARRRGVDARGVLGDVDAARGIVRVAGEVEADEIIVGRDQWSRWMAAGFGCGHLVLHTPCTVTISRVPEEIPGRG